MPNKKTSLAARPVSKKEDKSEKAAGNYPKNLRLGSMLVITGGALILLSMIYLAFSIYASTTSSFIIQNITQSLQHQLNVSERSQVTPSLVKSVLEVVSGIGIAFSLVIIASGYLAMHKSNRKNLWAAVAMIFSFIELFFGGMPIIAIAGIVITLIGGIIILSVKNVQA
ncbi:MAG: hypothetical protein ACP5LP_02975 [Candidatus Micrarchaeia archaeon]